MYSGTLLHDHTFCLGVEREGHGFSRAMLSNKDTPIIRRVLAPEAIPGALNPRSNDFTSRCGKIPLLICVAPVSDRISPPRNRPRPRSPKRHWPALSLQWRPEAYESMPAPGGLLRGRPPDQDSLCWRWKTPDRSQDSRPKSDRPRQLVRIVRRNPEPAIRSDDPSHRFRREIVLPDMDAIEFGCQAQIGAVVHDQLERSAADSPLQFARLLQHHACVSGLIAVLQQMHPPPQVPRRTLQILQLSRKHDASTMA